MVHGYQNLVKYLITLLGNDLYAYKNQSYIITLLPTDLTEDLVVLG